MPSGRGSSSSSYVFAEAIRAGTAPVAVVLGEADAIVALGVDRGRRALRHRGAVVVSAGPGPRRPARRSRCARPPAGTSTSRRPESRRSRSSPLDSPRGDPLSELPGVERRRRSLLRLAAAPRSACDARRAEPRCRRRLASARRAARRSAPPHPAGPPLEERRLVTIVFADLAGFTEHSDQADPEDVRRILVPFHAVAKEEIERFGGTLDKFIGDAAMGVFGAPMAHEDDPERAVRAALAIRERVTRGQPAGAHRGAHGRGAGHVRGGSNGRGTGRRRRRQHRLAAAVVRTRGLGDRRGAHRARHPPRRGVRAAARDAGEGQGRAARGVRGDDRARRHPRAGGGRPAAVRRSRSASGSCCTTCSSARSATAPRAWSRSWASPASARRGSCSTCTIICGPPTTASAGIADGAVPSVSRSPTRPSTRSCDRSPASCRTRPATSCGAASTPTSAELDLNAEDRDWLATRLRPLVGLPVDDDTPGRRRRDVHGVGALPRVGGGAPTAHDRRRGPALGRRRPARVPRTAHGTRARRSAVPAVHGPAGAVRPSPGVGRGRRERDDDLALAAHRPGDVRAARLAAAAIGDVDRRERRAPAPRRREPALRPGVRAHAAGPRASTVVRSGPTSAGRRGVGVPDTVQALIAARLDALEAPERVLLQAASVIGDRFWRGALVALEPDPPDLDASVHTLQRRGLIRRSSTSAIEGEAEFSFAHALIRDVAYGRLPRAARSRLHRRRDDVARHRRTTPAWRRSPTCSRRTPRAPSTWLGPPASKTTSPSSRPPPCATSSLAGDRQQSLDAARAAGYYRQALALAPPGHRARRDPSHRHEPRLAFRRHDERCRARGVPDRRAGGDGGGRSTSRRSRAAADLLPARPARRDRRRRTQALEQAIALVEDDPDGQGGPVRALRLPVRGRDVRRVDPTSRCGGPSAPSSCRAPRR